MKEEGLPFNFESLLEASVILHGHLCPGQVLGVKMSMLGLREIGIADPRGIREIVDARFNDIFKAKDL